MARKPACDDPRRAQGPHAPTAIAGRRIASRHHAERCRLASVNIITTAGFRGPATDARWRSNDYLLLCGMPRGRGQCRQNPRRFWHCRIAWKAARALCYGKTGTSGTESSEPSGRDAGCGKCDSVRRVALHGTSTRTRVLMRPIDGASVPDVLRISPLGQVQVTTSPCYPYLIWVGLPSCACARDSGGATGPCCLP